MWQKPWRSALEAACWDQGRSAEVDCPNLRMPIEWSDALVMPFLNVLKAAWKQEECGVKTTQKVKQTK
jgi:hypothetical protein